MQTMNIVLKDQKFVFSEARRLAVQKAGEVLTEPVIIAWKDDTNRRFGPEIPGGSETRWHDYGENFGGSLEMNVGDTFHFIFTESSEFETPDLNLTSISESDGTTILCLNEACTEEDRKHMGHFAGGGIGG